MSERTWIITGANRGLGRALAHSALNTGDAVVATVRGEHSLPEHERLLVHRLDVRDRDGARGTVERAEQHFGAVDVLVNNAGSGHIGAIEELSEDDARTIIDTNLLGALWLTQAALPGMRERGRGHIVQISTVGAVGTMPTLGAYNASKWGLEGFSEALSNEVRNSGIRVTIAELGGIDTEWATGSMRFSEPLSAYDDLREQLFGTSHVPWPASGETGGGTAPEEAASAIVRHVLKPDDDRLRLIIGDDAPAQIDAALKSRIDDYTRDTRYAQLRSK